MSDFAFLTVTREGGNPVIRRKSAAEAVPVSASPVYGSVTDNPAVIPDAAGERLMRSVAVNIEPAQSGSGDPAPDNVRAISGWTGAVIRHGASLMDDYGWTAGMMLGSSGEIQETNLNRKLSAKIPVSGLTKITGMAWTDDGTDTPQWVFRIAAYDASDGFLSMLVGVTMTAGVTVYVTQDKTLPEGTAYVRMSVFGPWSAAVFDTSVFAGQNIAFPSEAGTVYGGVLDLTAGTLTVDRLACRLDSLSWDYAPSYGRFSNNSLKNVIRKSASNSDIPYGLLCSAYRNDGASNTSQTAGNGSVAVAVSGSVYIRDERYADVTEWLAEVGSQTLVYPLAEPVVYQLTPLQIAALAGDNTFWADCGPVSVEYVRDTGAAIDAGEADTRAMIGEVSGTTASRSLAVGEYVTVGDKLYRVTSAVGAGETLVPGNNVTQTTVGAELTALSALIAQ